MASTGQREPEEEEIKQVATKVRRVVVILDSADPGGDYRLVWELKPDQVASPHEREVLCGYWDRLANEIQREEPGIGVCAFIQVVVSRLGAQWQDVGVGLELPADCDSMEEFCRRMESRD